ncbi:hypothetical protein AGMMS50267_18390 [Spirochaetia bacterium]|nr:hypothetical protein AGMMS50267_18390 [Spirochaetia bacterium]
MEDIYIEYLPKLNEHLEAYSLYESKTHLKIIDKVVSILLIVFGVIILSMSLIYGFSISNIMIAILLMVIGIADFMGFIDFGKIVISIQFKNNNKLKDIQKIKFRDNGLEYETKGIKSNIKWELYTKYYEGENIFILIYGNRLYSVIPKYALNNKLELFRNMVDKKIKRI